MDSSIISDIKLSNKDDFIYCLSLLNDIGYFEDMVELIKSVNNIEDYELDYKESVLLGSAFKNALNVKRKEKSIVDNVLQEDKISEDEKNLAEILRGKLYKDIRNIGKISYIIIRTKCIPKTTKDEVLLYYWHLMGDIMRYCADTFTEDAKKKLHKKSLQAYTSALEFAYKLQLPPSNANLLEILVNLSVLHRDMNEDLDYAIEMAAQAFRDAIQNMHLLENDEEYSKTIAILGLLRDNINSWCEISGRKNVNALFETKVDGEKIDKFKNLINNVQA